MRTRLRWVWLAIALLALAPAAAFGQASIVVVGSETVTVGATAVGLSAGTMSRAGLTANVCSGVLETAAMRMRVDGTAPTAAIGTPVAVGQGVEVGGAAAVAAWRMIRSTGSSGAIFVTCFFSPTIPAAEVRVFSTGTGGGGGGTGDVVGPGSATDGHLTVFDGTTGKLVKDGGAVPAGGGGDVTQAGDNTFTGTNVFNTHPVTVDSIQTAATDTGPTGPTGDRVKVLLQSATDNGFLLWLSDAEIDPIHYGFGLKITDVGSTAIGAGKDGELGLEAIPSDSGDARTNTAWNFSGDVVDASTSAVFSLGRDVNPWKAAFANFFSGPDSTTIKSMQPPLDGVAFTPTLAGAGAGSVDNGVHSYKFTQSDDDGHETQVGTQTPDVTVVDNSSDGQVTVPLPPVCTSTMYHLNVYRTEANGSTYKLVETTSCASSFTDSVDDASLGATAPDVSTAQIPITFAGERILLPNGQLIFPSDTYLFGADAATDNQGNSFTVGASSSVLAGGGLLEMSSSDTQNNGGGVTITAGSSQTHNGGPLYMYAGGSTSNGTGGVVSIAAGNAGAGNAGGNVFFYAGNGQPAGSVIFAAGNAAGGSGADGGGIALAPGAGDGPGAAGYVGVQGAIGPLDSSTGIHLSLEGLKTGSLRSPSSFDNLSSSGTDAHPIVVDFKPMIGEWITVEGVTPDAYNGTFQVSAVQNGSEFHYKFSGAGDSGGTGGTIQHAARTTFVTVENKATAKMTIGAGRNGQVDGYFKNLFAQSGDSDDYAQVLTEGPLGSITPLRIKLGSSTGTDVATVGAIRVPATFESGSGRLIAARNDGDTGDVRLVTWSNNELQLGDNAGQNDVILRTSASELDVRNNRITTADQTHPGILLAINGVGSAYGVSFLAMLPAPFAPALTQGGTPGAATVSYRVIGYDTFGRIAVSDEATTTTANATLDVTNFNTLDQFIVGGYEYYEIYRTAGGPSQGKIAGPIFSYDQPFNDTGLAGDSASPPSGNTTEGVIIGKDVVITGSVQPTGYVSADGSTGATGAGCAAFKDGLCVTTQAATLPNFSCTTGSIGGSLLAGAGTTVTGTCTATGATVGMPVAVSASDGTLPGGLVVLSAAVTSTNTVTVQLSAIAAVTPSAKTYNCRVIQ